MSNTLEAIGDRVSPGRIVQRKKNKVVGGVQSVRERLMGSATATRDKLAETAGQAGSAVSDAPDAVLSKTQGAPMLVGALAFGVGFLAAVAFPASAKERELSTQVLDAVEPAKGQLVDSAHEMADPADFPSFIGSRLVYRKLGRHLWWLIAIPLVLLIVIRIGVLAAFTTRYPDTDVWVRRAEILAAIAARRRTVAVSGTHGKTTTTAMLSVMLLGAELDPGFIVGGDLVGLGGARWSHGEWFVVEADESDGTFTELPAEVAVVTNVEADHLDHFGSNI